MKAAMIYYSLEGNMDYLAEQSAQMDTVECIKLVPSKEYPTGKFSKFLWGGKSVTFGEKPKLLNDRIDLSQYDLLILGTPIWASTFTPPLNTFLHEYHFTGKKIILLATHAGGGGAKAFAKMKELLSGNEILAAIDFRSPLKYKDEEVHSKLNQIKALLLND